MTADYHIHSEFSGDSEASPEDIIRTAVSRGLSAVCFTEHLDPDYPYDDVCFDLDLPAYFNCMDGLREKYSGQIEIRTGVELGLQPQLSEVFRTLLAGQSPDFIIGSTHLVDRADPYYPDYWEGRTAEEAIDRYLDVILENIRAYDDFDVCGHLDYVVRYVPDPGNRRFDFERFADKTDAVLKLLIEKGKGIEVNTGSYRAGLSVPHPCPEVIRRYRELGGEIVTIGSDAHDPEYVGSHFEEAAEILKSAGFRYFTVFRGRKPAFEKL